MVSCFRKQKQFQSKDLRTSMFASAAFQWTLPSYPTIFDLRGENSTRSSREFCPSSFQWTSQSKNGAGGEARAVKLSQHSWRYTVVGTDFVHQAVFFSSHRPIPCTWEMLCLMFFFFALLSNCFCNPKSPNQSKVVLFIQRSKSSVWYNSMLSLRDLLVRLIFITRPLPQTMKDAD